MKFRIGIILSCVGVEGVQIFNATPETQKEVLIILPELHGLLKKIDEKLKEVVCGTTNINNFE